MLCEGEVYMNDFKFVVGMLIFSVGYFVAASPSQAGGIMVSCANYGGGELVKLSCSGDMTLKECCRLHDQ